MLLISLLLLLFGTEMMTFQDLVEVNMIYYEQPPFIFRNEYDKDKKLEGIFPEMAEQAKEFCDLQMNFKVDTIDINNFTRIFNSTLRGTHYLDNQYIWMPLIKDLGDRMIKERNLSQMSMFESPGMEVIAHRNSISLLVKLWKGVEACFTIIVLAMFMLFIFAAAFWGLVSSYLFSIVMTKVSYNGLFGATIYTIMEYSNIVEIKYNCKNKATMFRNQTAVIKK